MASPIESWEGAEVIFTFADSPAVTGFALLASILLTAGVIIATFMHENHSFSSMQDD